MSTRKAKKPAGMLWRWLTVVEEVMEADKHNVPVKRHAVLAVALMRARAADADGSRSYPSREAMAKRSQLKPETVLAADRWLEAQGLMRYVRKTQWRVKEYRLTIPPAAPNASLERQEDSEVMAPEGGNTPAPIASPIASHDASPGGDYLLPPNVSEEEEEGPTAGPDGPPPTVTPEHLEQAERLVSNLVGEGHDLDAEQLVPVLAEYLATTAAGWAAVSVLHRCTVILSKARTNPTAYLVVGLRRDAGLRSVPLPTWAQAANEFEVLHVWTLHLFDLAGGEGPAADAGDDWGERLFRVVGEALDLPGETLERWGSDEFGPSPSPAHYEEARRAMRRHAEQLPALAAACLRQHEQNLEEHPEWFDPKQADLASLAEAIDAVHRLLGTREADGAA